MFRASLRLGLGKSAILACFCDTLAGAYSQTKDSLGEAVGLVQLGATARGHSAGSDKTELRGLPLQCSPEHVDLVRQYFSLLEAHDVDGLLSMFAPDSFIVSQHQGRQEPAEVFNSTLVSESSGTIEEIDMLCSLSAGTSLVITSKVKFTVHQEEQEDDRTFIEVDVFRIAPEDPDGKNPAKVHSLEIYGNSFVTDELFPELAVSAWPNVGPTYPGSCPQDQIDLVRAYLRLLVEQDAGGIADLFEPEGFMVGSRMGKVEARKYFTYFLSTVSDVVTHELAISCSLKSSRETSSMAVNFHIDYKVLETGAMEGGITLDTLYITPGSGTTPPKFQQIEMFDDENVDFVEEVAPDDDHEEFVGEVPTKAPTQASL